jgi:hypothetical protein
VRPLSQGHVGADEDDVTALPAHHGGEDRSGQSVGADQVNLNLGLEVRRAGFVEAAELRLAGAGHQDLDIAEFLGCPPDESVDRVGVGDIQ